MVKVIGIGDNVCDIYIHTGIMYPGGQAFNYATYARMLGAESAFIGAHGDDPVGQRVIEILDQRGIDRSHTRIYPGEENGFACVKLEDGDRVFCGSNRGGVLQKHPIILQENDLQYISGFEAVHMSNNGFTDLELPKLKGLGPWISYDFSYRWTEEERVNRVCPYVDVAFASCSDLSEEEIWKLCEHMHEKGCDIVVATRGSDGAFASDGENHFRQLPHLVQAIDTMGAGDSFASAFMVAVAEKVTQMGKDVWKKKDDRKAIIRNGLERAAEFSSKICLISGGSGDGIRVPEEMYNRIQEITKTVSR